ncbi:MAG: iron-containing alcohol dehydrogenase [Pseudomonadota bacterium]
MSLAAQTFQIRPLPTLIFGAGSAKKLAAQVQALGRKNVLVVTDKGLMGSGAADEALAALSAAGVGVEIFDGVEANPTDRNVEAGAARLAGMQDAAVLALGGGSSMDCGKAIALLATNPGSVADLQKSGPKAPGVPIIAVATTAGTGSETNSACVITNTALGRKTYVMHPTIVPAFAVLDPELTLGLPAYPTATCGFDVFTHALEAFTSLRATPYSDAVALKAIEMVAANLRNVVADGSNLEGRSQMMLASSMAAIAFNVAGLGAAHGTGHALSARLNAAHGQTLATMLPHVMAFNMPAVAAKYAQVAAALGAAAQAEAAIGAVVSLRADIGIARSITDLGGSAAMVPQLAEDAAADGVNLSNPRQVTPPDFVALYEAAL